MGKFDELQANLSSDSSDDNRDCNNRRKFSRKKQAAKFEISKFDQIRLLILKVLKKV